MFADEVSSVLDSLQPHPDLKELTISGTVKGYHLLVNCHVSKHLLISSLTRIKHVRRMFYGYDKTSRDDCRSSTSRAFPTLDTLKFMNMNSWEQYSNGMKLRPQISLCLHHLTIVRCSKLRGLPKLQILQNLQIKNCENLLDLPSFPSLQCISVEAPYISHLGLLELRCRQETHISEKDTKFCLSSQFEVEKRTVTKFSGCQVLPFPNLSDQDSQKTWVFLRCTERILQCYCNFVAYADLSFRGTNVQLCE
ncbi:hypothetical protein EJB05_37493, partial [Eragrostis curvula]